MSDLLSTIDAIARIQGRIDANRMSQTDLTRSRQTMSNLVKNLATDDIIRLMIAHHDMTKYLKDVLKSWHVNKLILQQGIQKAHEFGDNAEKDRLSARLAGIVLLYEQIQNALQVRNNRVKHAKTNV